MISNRNDIFRCLIIGSCLFIFWGVIIIWIVSYQNLCHALYLTLYFSKYSGVTIIWNSTRSMPWDVPINWNMSSNWHQRVGEPILSTLIFFYQRPCFLPAALRLGLMEGRLGLLFSSRLSRRSILDPWHPCLLGFEVTKAYLWEL